jgi:hypothetical protein
MRRLWKTTRRAGGWRTSCGPIKGPRWVRDDDDDALEQLQLISSQRVKDKRASRGGNESERKKRVCREGLLSV